MSDRDIEKWVRGRMYRDGDRLFIEPSDNTTILDMGRRTVTGIGANSDGSNRVKRDDCGAEEMIISAVVALVAEAVETFSATSALVEDSEALERLRSAARERKAKRRGAREMILRLAQRDGFTCSLCGEHMPDVSDIEVDHVIPVSKGGSSQPENLKLAHSKCNAKKGNRT